LIKFVLNSLKRFEGSQLSSIASILQNLRIARERILLVNFPNVLKSIEDEAIRISQLFGKFGAVINSDTEIVASYDQLNEAE
jgi:hypothetical protein